MLVFRDCWPQFWMVILEQRLCIVSLRHRVHPRVKATLLFSMFPICMATHSPRVFVKLAFFFSVSCLTGQELSLDRKPRF